MANIKWSYMDHWSTRSPRGLVSPDVSARHMDRYIKQIAGLGFTGFDTFAFRLHHYARMFGSIKAFEQFLKERGIDKVVSLFQDYAYTSPTRAPHIRATHDTIFHDVERIVEAAEGLELENLIVMPASTYWQVEPVTDEKIAAVADLWNKVGEMTIAHGIKVSVHHEFWCGIRSVSEIEKFYKWTDPRYVFYFCDTAQHVIAGVDPVEIYLKYHDRCAGLHFKDTRNVDTKGEYRLPPDGEMMAPSVARWFWEMGTAQGLCDFPTMMKALKEYSYRGWISVEHDKADIGGGNYAESTCISRWYIDNVLSRIYA
jgi:inosose dehydratase